MKPKTAALSIAFVIALLLSFPAAAQNVPIFSDQFDDGIIGGWTVNFVPEGTVTAVGWEYEESIGEPSSLTVTDLFGEGFSPLGWIIVHLTRDIPPVRNFNVTMRISWTGQPLPNDGNGKLILAIRDSSGRHIVSAGYSDSWLIHTGTWVATPCTPAPCFVPGSAGHTGSADVTLDRTDNLFTFTWVGSNGLNITRTATVSTLDATSIELAIQHFDGGNTGEGGVVPFGTLGVDHITVNGIISAVPPSIPQLLTDVMALNLSMGISNSLDAKLNAALAALDDTNENNDIAAINSLGAFINAVEAQIGNQIPIEKEAEARALITDAEAIIDMLSGS